MTLFHDVWDASSPSHSLNSCEAVDGLLTGLHWSRLEMTSSSVWLGVTCRVLGLSVSYVIVLAPVALIMYCKILIVFLILLLVDKIRLWGVQEHLPSLFPTYLIKLFFFFFKSRTRPPPLRPSSWTARLHFSLTSQLSSTFFICSTRSCSWMSCREPELHHWSVFYSSWPGKHSTVIWMCLWFNAETS